MPIVLLHRDGESFRGEVAAGSNLVIRAATRHFPHPHLRYGCTMGKCGRCASRVIRGAEHLPAPNWKERERLGAWLDQGFRLMCQLWLSHDIELDQHVLIPPAGATP